MPLVSVIIPVYNAERYLRRTLRSVYAQTLRDFEIIAVDDGSTDGTRALLKSYNGIRYIYQNNAGPSAARNKGIMAASGRYVAFLDQDDIFLPDKLETQVRLLEADRRLHFMISDARVVDERGKTVGRMTCTAAQRQHPFEELLKRCYIITPSQVVVRRQSVFDVGLFDEKLWEGDWDFYIRMCRRYGLAVVGRELVCWRSHRHNASKNIGKLERIQLRTLEKVWDGERSLVYPAIKRAVHFRIHFDLGVEYFEQGEMASARRHFLKSLARRPCSRQVYLYLLKSLLGAKLFAVREIKHRLFPGAQHA